MTAATACRMNNTREVEPESVDSTLERQRKRRKPIKRHELDDKLANEPCETTRLTSFADSVMENVDRERENANSKPNHIPLCIKIITEEEFV